MNKAIYDKQIEYLTSGDLEGLMSQYADNAVVVRFDKIIRGKEELREMFKRYLKYLGTFQLVSTDKYAETEDSIFFEATVKSNLGTVKVYDVFILNSDHKIIKHFTGVIS